MADIAPDSWAATKQAQTGIDVHWIKRFNDPKLEKLVKEGITNNGNLRANAERLTQAANRARIAAGASTPQLSTGVTGQRQQSQFLGIPGVPNGVRFNSFGVSTDLSWEIDLWGRLRAAHKAELSAYEAEAWDLKGAEASLQAQIAKAWFALTEARQQISLAQEAVEIRKKTQDAIAERFERALSDEGGSGAQYRVAQSDVATAKAEVARWQGQLDSASRQLELLIGRYPSGNLKGSTLPEIGATPPVGLPSELLLRRPDILSAERKYTEAVQRNKEAVRAIFPAFSLTGAVGTSTTELSNIFNNDFSTWSIGGNITQAILTGGRLFREKDIRKSETKATFIELKDTVLNAFGEVETTLATEKYIRLRLSETEKALTLAKEASEAAQQDFRDGATDIQTALNAETRIIQAASSAVSLQRLLLENRIDLHLSLGGDYKLRSK